VCEYRTFEEVKKERVKVDKVILHKKDDVNLESKVIVIANSGY